MNEVSFTPSASLQWPSNGIKPLAAEFSYKQWKKRVRGREGVDVNSDGNTGKRCAMQRRSWKREISVRVGAAKGRIWWTSEEMSLRWMGGCWRGWINWLRESATSEGRESIRDGPSRDRRSLEWRFCVRILYFWAFQADTFFELLWRVVSVLYKQVISFSSISFRLLFIL